MMATDFGAEVSGIAVLTSGIEEALRLLRSRRYAQLERHVLGLEARAGSLRGLQEALEGGAAAPENLRQSCERLGRRLHLLSEVARQVTQIEFGITQLVAAPSDTGYGRDGQCADAGASRFRHQA